MTVLTCSGIWATSGGGERSSGRTLPCRPRPWPASLSASRATSRLVNRVPTTAEPSDDPIWRKKLWAPVAVPTSVMGNEFCTMSTRIWKPRPVPTPKTNR